MNMHASNCFEGSSEQHDKTCLLCSYCVRFSCVYFFALPLDLYLSLCVHWAFLCSIFAILCLSSDFAFASILLFGGVNTRVLCSQCQFLFRASIRSPTLQYWKASPLPSRGGVSTKSGHVLLLLLLHFVCCCGCAQIFITFIPLLQIETAPVCIGKLHHCFFVALTRFLTRVTV